MPEWASLALTAAGAIILLLVGIVGWMYQEDRAGLSTRMKEGFDEVKQMFVAQTARFDKIDERQNRLAKDCLTWHDLRELGFEDRLRAHDRDIAALKATCKAKHEEQ
jgi:hypothetical protein